MADPSPHGPWGIPVASRASHSGQYNTQVPFSTTARTGCVAQRDGAEQDCRQVRHRPATSRVVDGLSVSFTGDLIRRELHRQSRVAFALTRSVEVRHDPRP
jgi:hypothetical protein